MTPDDGKITLVLTASPGHSGHTWLNLMLGAHSEVLAVGEINWAQRRASFKGACSLCGEGCEFWDVFDERWDREKNFFLSLADFSGKRIISPSGWGEFESQFDDPAIDLKIIRLIRDGRGATAGYRRKYPETDYENFVRKWSKASRGLDKRIKKMAPKDTYVLRYEDLLDGVEDRLRELCVFLGIDYEPEMPEYWNRAQHIVGANQGTLSFMRKTLGMETPEAHKVSDENFYKNQDPKNFKDERWKRELLPADLATFERAAGKLNESYGYPPSEIPWRPLRMLQAKLAAKANARKRKREKNES